MESITIKVDPAFARAMEKAMKPMYSTKTEFIRAAIREKVERERQREESLRILHESFGKFKPKKNLSDREIREVVGREHALKQD